MHRTHHLFSFFVVALFFSVPFAASAEIIHSFDTQLAIREDGMLHIVETIRYDFEGAERHGIYRDIPLWFLTEDGQERWINVSHLSAADASGVPYATDITEQNKNEHIRIGDPDALVSGEKIYVISYDIDGAIIPLADGEELYWNATGNEWPVAIEHATTSLALPPSVTVLTSACYEGSSGSKEMCAQHEDTSAMRFIATRALHAREGLTIAAAFPEDAFPIHDIPAESDDELLLFPAVPVAIFWMLGALIALLCALYAYIEWAKHGKDPRGKGTIIPYYEAPKNLSPIESALLVYQRIESRDVTAEVVYLACNGALKIVQEKESTLGIFSSTDYRLVETGGAEAAGSAEDQMLYRMLFADANIENGARSMRLSKIRKSTFQQLLTSLKEMIRISLVSKSLYDGSTVRYGKLVGLVGGVLFFSGAALIAFAGVSLVNWPHILPFLLGLVIGGLACLLAASQMSRVTPEGALHREELLGLKEYLQIAEKHRLAFHNAPDKHPETFEKLLPFAIMFGVERAWAKEFEDIYKNPPSWYESHGEAFSAIALGNSLHVFSDSFTAATTVSSSGAGGGGFSGGGGGGGGGGSW